MNALEVGQTWHKSVSIVRNQNLLPINYVIFLTKRHLTSVTMSGLCDFKKSSFTLNELQWALL